MDVMARDSLRATLDDLKLGPEAAKDRPYLEAMLRRLGYTETEIQSELGPAIEADRAPAPPVRDDGLAPAREYRLVIPARESAFSFAPPEGEAYAGSDSPFEAFERVEFEETPAGADVVEFEEAAPEEVIEFEEAAPLEEPEPLEFEEAPPEEPPMEEPEPLQEFQPADVESLTADEPAGAAEDVSLDTFGSGQVDAKPKTRVRVKRVRAKSKQEAEGKVASSNRKVIKSIPVDIVERWGPGEKDKAGKKEDK
jgi:hypothetical protein